MNRPQKMRILSELLNGKPRPLQDIYANRGKDFDQMTDEELQTVIDRDRQRKFRETGIIPPPQRDYEAMTDEELDVIITAGKQKLP